MSGSKVAREVAMAEIARWCDAWDIDTETGAMAEDDRGVFQNMTDRLTRKVCQGNLWIDDEGNPHFSPQFSEDRGELTFRIPSGADRLSWDKYKDRETIHRIFATLSGMTGQPPAYFSKMDGRDLKVAEALALLYLGS
jgi:hypothetical protein